MAKALQREVDSMLVERHTKVVSGREPTFYSRLFPVEKASGKWRTVIEILPLVTYSSDKVQEGDMTLVLASIRTGDFMFPIDLKDAYFQILIHPELGPCFQFILNGKIFQFKALYFGFLTAFHFFTRVIMLVSARAHRWDIHLLHYFNNWLVIMDSLHHLVAHCSFLRQFC